MKPIVVLSLILILVQGTNIRRMPKSGNSESVLLQTNVEEIGEVVDLSNNVGVIDASVVEVTPPLTKQAQMAQKAEHKENQAVHMAIQHSYKQEIETAHKKEQVALNKLFQDSEISFAQISQEVEQVSAPVEENQQVPAEGTTQISDADGSPMMGQDAQLQDVAEAPMMISVDLDPENQQDIQVTTEEVQTQFTQDTQVDALSLIQIKQESNDNENVPFVEETLDQLDASNIVENQDVYQNDGHSPNMGEQAILEDAPIAPMMILLPDDNDYVRAVDQMDMIDESGMAQINPDNVTFFIQTYDDYDRSLPLLGEEIQDTPIMKGIPENQLAPMQENTSMESSPGLNEVIVERETEEIVSQLEQEEANDQIEFLQMVGIANRGFY